MKRSIATLLAALLLSAAAAAGEVKVINPEAAFPEGPVWHDGTLYYVEYGGHRVVTWDGNKNAPLWKQDGCGPAAVVPTADGDFLVTCYDAGTLVRISADGKTLATYDKDADGNPFVGPNDFAADAKGGVYFTASGPWESAPIVGNIFYITPGGEIVKVADHLHYANGLALSRDGTTLYCAESEAHRVIQFTVKEEGALFDRRVFAKLRDLDPEAAAPGYPDGLKLDSQGNLYIAQLSAGRVLVVTPEAKLARSLDVPSPSAPNLAFGASEEVVYVMAVDDVENAPWPGKVYELANRPGGGKKKEDRY